MKKLRESFAAKLIAVILLCGMAVACAASGMACVYLYDSKAYTGGYEAAARNVVGSVGRRLSYEAGSRWREGIYTASGQNANFRCEMYSMEGEELYSDYAGEATLWDEIVLVQPEYDYWTELRDTVPPGVTGKVDLDETPEPASAETPDVEKAALMAQATPTPQSTQIPRETAPGTAEVIMLRDINTGASYTFADEAGLQQWIQDNSLRVHGYALRDLSPGDPIWEQLRSFNWFYATKNLWPALAVGSLLLGILLFLFLLASAGHHPGEEEVRESFVDRIPLDLFALLFLSAEGIVFTGFMEGGGWAENAVGVTVVGLLCLAAMLLLLLFCMSFAVRVKRGTVWQNCLIVRLLRWCWHALQVCARALGVFLQSLPLVWKWVVILLGLAGLEFLLLLATHNEGLILWFFGNLVAIPAVLYAVICFHRLRLGGREIADGNLNCRIDTRYLIGAMKEHAQDLNHIRDGLNDAVAERMKSERFRTELITNVSHDIRTPLTSIINYVDLLAREEPENEKSREYLEVLQRQSARLKKLIDDLIEASKASTGNLTAEKEPVELGVLLTQTAGEYGERLAEAQLELVLNVPEQAVNILADGRHMWRIFDNLMNNIVKYSQPGTRVYLDLAAQAEGATITFRNISRSQLNISGDELMERFVRGDSARNTEGSGLGLSIARSLAQLQGGDLELTVDGDLFKVCLRFPLA